MNISQLVKDIASIPKDDDPIVTGLCSDSRQIKPGDCFFAIKGEHEDGSVYISSAIEKGASAVVMDQSGTFSGEKRVPVIKVPKLSEKLGDIAARYYHYPSEQLEVVGITGTNGKTSTSQYIAKALNMASGSCAVMGTLGYGFPDQLSASTHTTAQALELQRQLADLCQRGAQAVAMEVSSHALDQHRTKGVAFDIAIFTNLTHDHLDYHGSMEKYAESKKKLFYMEGLQAAIINTDDPFGVALAKELKGKLNVYCYGLKENLLSLPTVLASQVHLNVKGMTAKISAPFGQGQLKSKLLGRFNISNLLAVLTSLHLLKIPFEESLEYLSHLGNVPGRMQVFGGGKMPLVVVDYAHTPDALAQVLEALREHTHGKLWCLFGCGGDRDRSKRPLMGQIAERLADQVVITDDNPRTENPVEIVTEIMAGLLCPWAVEVEHDRGAAIAHVISCAQAGDVVLVAGKGHENYQIVGVEKIPFSDSEHIQEQLKKQKGQ